MGQYIPVLALIVLGVLFAAGSFIASALLAPHKRWSDAKLAPYECGIVPEYEPPARFPVRFYLVAMIFLLFDIEVAFLYPWALAIRELGWTGFVQVVMFMALLLAGYIYVWRKGALDWV